jgi:Cu2+-exporting ATPase
MTASACFHCALPVDTRDKYQVEIDGELRSVCCPGCKAVAELIRDTGMSSYYVMREAPQPGVGRPADDAAEWQIYDRDDMLAAFTDQIEARAEGTIYVGGMYCAACGWLIETTLSQLPGVVSADVNPVTHRVRVSWHTADLGLGGILKSLADLGYEPQPLAPESAARPEVAEQRTALKRLLVASLGMMQVMMFAVGLYAGDFQGMEADMQRFLRVVSLVVTTPVVFYSARPFYAGAWRGIVRRMPGMDLPVSIAITAAFAGSIYSMMTNGPAVWFDSVVMFVFFLTLGRFLEMRARHRSIDRSTALSTVLPNTVTRCDGTKTTTIPASQLLIGDRVLVRPGESIPADGLLVSGETTVDEALLTGEAEPRLKIAGDDLIAGSVNLDGAIEMRVDRTGSDTTLGTISRMSERARYTRPAFVQLADRIAGYIVIAILFIALVVAAVWYVIEPDRAFVITLSVLVVTCPCALALATPAAFATAGTRLSELHLLITNGNAIEAMSKATRILFDKTGTLTRGSPTIVATEVFDDTFDATQCVSIAAALETVSTHPIANAFLVENNAFVATEQRVETANGVAGTIEGRRWRLGRRAFVTGDISSTVESEKSTSVYLGTDRRLVARFDLDDEIRRGVDRTLAALRNTGFTTELVSGDNEEPVRRVAEMLGISDYHFGCSPEDKLGIIRAAQQAGDIVVMVGDGINDAPVLAGADVSVAPVHGALLAQTSADIILLGESLDPIAAGVLTSRKTMQIVRQNLAWAIVYNAAALPLAAMGYVPPWAAAIGMSASSLIVVLNALRLSRFGAP